MLNAILIQGAFKLLLAIIGIIMGRITLFLMDKHIDKTKFGEWLSKASDASRSMYYSYRLIGVMVVIGLVLG